MNPTLKSFLIRAASALIALIILLIVCYFFQTPGLIGIVIAAILAANFEFVKIMFKDSQDLTFKILFFIFSTTVFLGLGFFPRVISNLLFPVLSVLWISFILLRYHKVSSLLEMQTLISKSILGFFYVGLLPASSLWIAMNPSGISWFVFLLSVVFSADTFAYIFGVLFGKEKIMPSVSPKKTREGALGGLLGSAVAGAIVGKLFLPPDLSLPLLMAIAVFAGFCGQIGDLFESLLKRVADVKDSGKIMPGHGGILDRIDAVLFASPVILLAAYLLTV